MNKFLTSIFILFFIGNLKSQTLITGKVSDEQQNPISWVSLTVSDIQGNIMQQIVSDESGFFSLKILKEQTKLYLKLQHLNFDDLKDTVSIYNNDTVSLHYTLIQKQLKLKTVQILQKKPLFRIQNDRYIVEVENQSAFKNLNSLEILSRSPGVFIQKGEDAISFLGKSNIMILIDGKETHMSQQELNNYLKTLSQHLIKNIELIPNPGAQFSASGVDAVININLNKSNFENLYLSAQNTISTGKFTGFNPSLQMNSPIGKSQLYIRVNQQQDKRYLNYKNQMDYEFDENTFNIEQNGIGNKTFKNQHATIGNRSFWNEKKTQLDVSIRYGGNKSTLHNLDKNDLIYTERVLKNRNKNYSIQGDFQHNINEMGSKITGQFFHGYYDKNEIHNMDSDFLIDSTLNSNQVHATLIKTDNSLHLNKVVLNYGLLFNHIQTQNKRLGLIHDEKKQVESVQAAYVSIQGDVKDKINLTTGIRFENSNTKLHLFPSFTISKSWESGASLLTGFTSGIRRPNLKQLHGFFQQIDNFSYTIGNPDLKAERSYNVSLSYNPTSSLFFNTSYTYVKDVIGQEIVWDEQINKQRYWFKNLSTQYSGNFGISYHLNFKNTVFIYLNSMVLRNHFKDKQSHQEFSNNAYTFHTNSTLNVTLPHSYSMDFSGYYYSSQAVGYIKVDPFYSFDTSIRKTFSKNQFSISLSGIDIFNNLKTAYSLQQPTQSVVSLSKMESRRIELSIRYTFGSQSKRLRDVKDGGQEVQKRINEEIKN